MELTYESILPILVYSATEKSVILNNFSTIRSASEYIVLPINTYMIPITIGRVVFRAIMNRSIITEATDRFIRIPQITSSTTPRTLLTSVMPRKPRQPMIMPNTVSAWSAIISIKMHISLEITRPVRLDITEATFLIYPCLYSAPQKITVKITVKRTRKLPWKNASKYPSIVCGISAARFISAPVSPIIPDENAADVT